ncbi:hypothetical protein GQ42DRAFT_155896 [Ramicandelaber brevisporus]|nr:hypothetical protein GQ42DRAFT_155896 [Ramicandelaber brevisporus]
MTRKLVTDTPDCHALFSKHQYLLAATTATEAHATKYRDWKSRLAVVTEAAHGLHEEAESDEYDSEDDTDEHLAELDARATELIAAADKLSHIMHESKDAYMVAFSQYSSAFSEYGRHLVPTAPAKRRVKAAAKLADAKRSILAATALFEADLRRADELYDSYRQLHSELCHAVFGTHKVPPHSAIKVPERIGQAVPIPDDMTAMLNQFILGLGVKPDDSAAGASGESTPKLGKESSAAAGGAAGGNETYTADYSVPLEGEVLVWYSTNNANAHWTYEFLRVRENGMMDLYSLDQNTHLEYDLTQCNISKTDFHHRQNVLQVTVYPEDTPSIYVQFAIHQDATGYCRTMQSFNPNFQQLDDGEASVSGIDIGLGMTSSFPGQLQRGPGSVSSASFGGHHSHSHHQHGLFPTNGSASGPGSHVGSLSASHHGNHHGSGQSMMTELLIGTLSIYGHLTNANGTSTFQLVSDALEQAEWVRTEAVLEYNASESALVFKELGTHQILYTINLNNVHRHNVANCHESVFGNQRSFLLRVNNNKSGSENELVYLSTDNWRHKTAWICAIMALTIPDVHHPNKNNIPDFRCARALQLRVSDIKSDQKVDHYLTVRLAGEYVGRTSVRHIRSSSSSNSSGGGGGGSSSSHSSHSSNHHGHGHSDDFAFSNIPSLRSGLAIAINSHAATTHRSTLLGEAFVNLETLTPGVTYQGHFPFIASNKDGSSGSASSADNNAALTNSDSSPSASSATVRQGHPPSLQTSTSHVGDVHLMVRVDSFIVLPSVEYRPLVNMLADFESRLTFDLHTVSHSIDWVVDKMLKVAMGENRALDWLTMLAAHEISKTDNPNILFRGNTLFTKGFDVYMRIVGIPYVNEAIGGVIRDICSRHIVCEVDPARLVTTSVTPSSLANAAASGNSTGSNGGVSSELLTSKWNVFKPYFRQLWNAIINSARFIPPDLREVFSRVRSLIDAKFGTSSSGHAAYYGSGASRRPSGYHHSPAIPPSPIPLHHSGSSGNLSAGLHGGGGSGGAASSNVRYTCISAMFFLRLICPALTSPRTFGIVNTNPDSQVMRTLVLLAKVLQAMANLSEVKEPHMMPMAEVIKENTPSMLAFLDALATPEANSADMSDTASIHHSHLGISQQQQHNYQPYSSARSFVSHNSHENYGSSHGGQTSSVTVPRNDMYVIPDDVYYRLFPSISPSSSTPVGPGGIISPALSTYASPSMNEHSHHYGYNSNGHRIHNQYGHNHSAADKTNPLNGTNMRPEQSFASPRSACLVDIDLEMSTFAAKISQHHRQDVYRLIQSVGNTESSPMLLKDLLHECDRICELTKRCAESGLADVAVEVPKGPIH